MAYEITSDCTACDQCVDACPISAISPGDPIYVISDDCVEFEYCAIECDDDAIVLKKEDSVVEDEESKE